MPLSRHGSLRRRATMAAAATGILAGALLAPAGAQAQAPAAPGAEATHDVPVAAGLSGQEATALAEDLGTDRTAGVYRDHVSDRMVVMVTDQAAAEEVREAEGLAEVVPYSTAELDGIIAEFNDVIDTGGGTAWGHDVTANQVFIEADSTVTDAEMAELHEAAEPYGDAVTINRLAGEIEPYFSGGDFIRSESGLPCTSGFNVRKKDNNDSLYFLTAGHCTELGGPAGSDWFIKDDRYIGYRAGSSFPGNDFGLIRHYAASVDKYGNVTVGSGVQDITHSRDPYADERVCATGFMSGHSCGRVQARNISVDYDMGSYNVTVNGLFRTNLCLQPGDSGGPVFNGDAALGLTSGGFPELCVSYHQPVNEALANYDVEVY